MLLVADDITTAVAQARAGEPAAWDRLFRRYQLPLYTYVFELVRHEQESLDIVQETFISGVRHLGSLREDEKFGSWLFGIAHQKCLQLWRKQNRRFTTGFSDREEEAEEIESTVEATTPSTLLLRKEQEEVIFALLDRLEAPHRSVLLLHFIEDFSIEQIAQITGCNIGTVKSRIHYAKRALKKLLEDR